MKKNHFLAVKKLKNTESAQLCVCVCVMCAQMNVSDIKLSALDSALDSALHSAAGRTLRASKQKFTPCVRLRLARGLLARLSRWRNCLHKDIHLTFCSAFILLLLLPRLPFPILPFILKHSPAASRLALHITSKRQMLPMVYMSNFCICFWFPVGTYPSL